MKWILKRPVGGALCILALALLSWAGLGSPVNSQPKQVLPAVEKATHEPYVEKLVEFVEFKMLPIPGGTYFMGSPPSEKGRGADEGPQHPVTLKPFWMCEIE